VLLGRFTQRRLVGERDFLGNDRTTVRFGRRESRARLSEIERLTGTIAKQQQQQQQQQRVVGERYYFQLERYFLLVVVNKEQQYY
jgi:hypothetical protein